MIETAILVFGSIGFFLSGLFLICWFALKEIERMNQVQRGWIKTMVDGFKAQLRSSINGIPGRMGKEARETVDYLMKELGEEE